MATCACRVWLLPVLLLILAGCRDGMQPQAQDTAADNPARNCHVQLFASPHFKGANVYVRGAGEFPALDEIREAQWGGNTVRSFKSGARTEVIFWTQPDFKGQTVTWDGSAAEPDMTPPRSMKIACKG